MNKSRHNVPAGVGRNTAREHLDSYTTREEKAEAGNLLCKRCEATHHDKRWYAPGTSAAKVLPAELKETLCPGCYRVERGISDGVVVLEGAATPYEMREDIMTRIWHIEIECWKENPSARIVDCIERDGNVEIKTTTVWLAERIGKELKSAFKGTLEVKPSPEKESVFVRWAVPKAIEVK